MDYQGRWAPLRHLLWAGEEGGLVSGAPESVVDELESTYCPDSFEFHMQSELLEASRASESARACPRCRASLRPLALSRAEAPRAEAPHGATAREDAPHGAPPLV